MTLKVNGRCKKCRSAYLAAWRKAHPDHKRQYYKANRARLLAQAKEYYRKNHLIINARNSLNRKLLLTIQPLVVRAQRRARANPEQRLASNRRRRALHHNSIGFFTATEWQKIVARQKGRCANCGCKNPLTADHIVPLSAGGCSYIWNIQGLCPQCNSRKQAKLTPDVQFGLFDRPREASLR